MSNSSPDRCNHGSSFMGEALQRGRRGPPIESDSGRGTPSRGPTPHDGGIGAPPSRSADPSLGSSNSSRRRRPNAPGEQRTGPNAPTRRFSPSKSTCVGTHSRLPIRVKNVAMQDHCLGAAVRAPHRHGLVVTSFCRSFELDVVIRGCSTSLCRFVLWSHYRVSKEIVRFLTNSAP